MEREEQNQRLQELNGDSQLTPMEITILDLLKTHCQLGSEVINVPRLQEDCQARGLTAQQFSHGFVRLLCRRLLEPRGEFQFSLSAEGRMR